MGAGRSKKPKTLIEMIEALEKRMDGVELDLEVLWDGHERRAKAKDELVTAIDSVEQPV